jgi:hypothetical protein
MEIKFYQPMFFQFQMTRAFRCVDDQSMHVELALIVQSGKAAKDGDINEVVRGSFGLCISQMSPRRFKLQLALRLLAPRGPIWSLHGKSSYCEMSSTPWAGAERPAGSSRQ